VLIDPLILLYDKKISKVVDLMEVLKYTVRDNSNPRSLLIIAASCEAEALGTLIYNKLKVGMNVCVIQAPEQGMKRLEVMQDIAIFTGGQVISEDQGTALDKQNFKPEFLGTASKVIVKQDSCVIVNGQGNPDKVEERQKQIKEMITEAPSDYEKEYLRKRAGSIGRGVAVLYIGAPTEIEKGDLKDLAEDAILATRSAIEEGFLPGGGVGFIRCAESLKPESAGEEIVIKSLYKPLLQILANNEEAHDILTKIIEGKNDYGYNAFTGEFGNLIEQGVIDAAKVIRCAIENAASVAAQFCATEVLISEIDD
jgi:chaperonin GroEL